MKFSKETLIQVIREAGNLEDAAAKLSMSRRKLGRLRRKYDIEDVRCSGPRTHIKLEQYDIGESHVQEFEMHDLSDLDKILSTYDTDFDRPVQSKKEEKEICKELGIDYKDLKVLRDNKQKSERPDEVDLNLETKFSGRFKEKTDMRHSSFRKFVITSIQNDTQINVEFYEALKLYCEINNAKLLVVPVYYNFNKLSRFNIPDEELFFNNIQLSNDLKLMTTLRILPTITDPFSGVDSLSKGDSIIIPHPQFAMKTMATLGNRPAQMYTTGSISLKEGAYARTKTGYKAEVNHCIAGLAVDLDGEDLFHVRGLNCDDNNGFYDIKGYYTKDTLTPLTHVEAIYLGDTHVGVIDPKVVNATWKDKDSMFNILKPKYAIHGDILDFSSQSHHDHYDYFTRVAKAATGKDNVKTELTGVGQFIRSSRFPGTKNLIIGSNHNEHLYKWLTTNDTKHDLVNAEIYHQLSYLMIQNIQSIPSGVSYPNLLQLWFENSDYKDILEYSEFLGRTDGFKIMDIEISMHGDKGPNGSRGSPNAFGRLPTKSIVGHSHSPSINKGCYTVGTSSMLNLSYNSGASSWLQSHCVIYPNGKRQMINIINGKWKAN